ncbi:MAG: HDOD domain-containing protein [Treponema sp.]|nr:HDOD domain-containing protein [Treponema sp.]
MDNQIDQAVLAYIKNLPSLPTTVRKVLEVCNNPQASPVDLNRVISLDPVLVARVIKLINSSYYSLGNRVTSLVRAVIMLGINTVKNMALSTAILANVFSKKKIPGLNMDEFWRHSLCTAVTAKFIAKKRSVDNKLLEEYFTAGLLHDIGKIPINAIRSLEYKRLAETAGNEGLSLYVAEERQLGYTHCNAGEMIARSWQLGGAIGDVITWHHSCLDYDGPYKDVLFTVVAANRFAADMKIGFAGDRHPPPLDPEVLQCLNMRETIIEELELVVNKEIEKASVFLKL